MNPLYKENKCDSCGCKFNHKDELIALVNNVEVECRNRADDNQIRLKLSIDSLSSRSIRIYCKQCLEIKDYIDDKS